MLYGRKLKGYLTFLASSNGRVGHRADRHVRTSVICDTGRLAPANELRNHGAFGCDNSRRIGSIFGWGNTDRNDKPQRLTCPTASHPQR